VQPLSRIVPPPVPEIIVAAPGPLAGQAALRAIPAANGDVLTCHREDGLLVCDVPYLEPGQSVEMQLVVLTNEETCGPLDTNGEIIAVGQVEYVLENNVDEAGANVICAQIEETSTPVNTATDEPSATSTATAIPSGTAQPSATRTATAEPGATNSPTAVPSATQTSTTPPTATRTVTPVPSRTVTASVPLPTIDPLKSPSPAATPDADSFPITGSGLMTAAAGTSLFLVATIGMLAATGWFVRRRNGTD